MNIDFYQAQAFAAESGVSIHVIYLLPSAPSAMTLAFSKIYVSSRRFLSKGGALPAVALPVCLFKPARTPRPPPHSAVVFRVFHSKGVSLGDSSRRLCSLQAPVRHLRPHKLLLYCKAMRVHPAVWSREKKYVVQLFYKCPIDFP